MSSLSQNPAGLGVYRSSEITVTPQLFRINTLAGFNGITSDYLYNFNLGQIGIVSSIYNRNTETGLISLNLGYSFNKTNNFNQSIVIQGINSTSSMADYWAQSSNGILKDNLMDAAGMAYDAWVTNTKVVGGLEYATVFSNYGINPTSTYGQNVRRIVSTSGYTGEHALSMGGNYSNKIFFGATFGISTLNYTSHYEHLESTNIALPSEFKNFTYTEHFENTGTGYNLKLGVIVKPVETIRIGLAFHTPTFYKIDETFYENLTSNFTNGGHHEYVIDPMRYSYALTTPFRVLTGVAVQIKKIALLSVDYEFVDYSIAKFSDNKDSYDYSSKNRDIKNSLKSASNIRLGGELRLNKLYLRTGYGYYGKAFKPGEENQNLDYTSISGGIGYREQNLSIDFAYTNYSYSQTNILYPLDSSFVPASANLSTHTNMFTLTLGYKFGL
ncbi:MAG TPA: hypothetical protein VIK07_07265, partial [Bacteroidales bacterium]